MTAKMYAEALKASDTIDLVPRPTFNPTFTWLAGQAVRAYWDSNNGDNIYDSVRHTVALKYKTDFAMKLCVCHNVQKYLWH